MFWAQREESSELMFCKSESEGWKLSFLDMRMVKNFPRVCLFYFSTNARQFVSLWDTDGQIKYLVKYCFTVNSLLSFRVPIRGLHVKFYFLRLQQSQSQSIEWILSRSVELLDFKRHTMYMIVLLLIDRAWTLTRWSWSWTQPWTLPWPFSWTHTHEWWT